MAEGCRRGNPRLKVLGPACYSIDPKEFHEYIRGGMFDNLAPVNIHAYVNATAPEEESSGTSHKCAAAWKKPAGVICRFT